MNKPKYKLGDIVYDRLCNSTELIISIEMLEFKFVWYRTIVIDGYRDSRYDIWSEKTLDEWYKVIGNILEDEHGRSC